MAQSKDGDAKARAWRLFLFTHTVLLERIEETLNAAGLPPLAWYDMLWELEKAEEGRLRMHEIADRIVLSRSNLTRLADRLESAGLIRREQCPGDRRGAYCAIAPAGREMRRKMWRVYEEQIEHLFAKHLTVASAVQLANNFTAMARAARQKAKSSLSRRSA
jgi:DNA-binding MarR family transcriptional regulator